MFLNLVHVYVYTFACVEIKTQTEIVSLRMFGDNFFELTILES